ncbi:hypothetical protein MSG28_003832 [Choristoneura fumiferana]|uniref:Uncharacterized protein n=1 Tax=Choristoneura fumiferana TaxID=7141 RepID=A0ACC0KG66_CHOFU|nr:hypothetical protein MSG28_003832 [Choristoneura fumiferana]
MSPYETLFAYFGLYFLFMLAFFILICLICGIVLLCYQKKLGVDLTSSTDPREDTPLPQQDHMHTRLRHMLREGRHAALPRAQPKPKDATAQQLLKSAWRLPHPPRSRDLNQVVATS